MHDFALTFKDFDNLPSLVETLQGRGEVDDSSLGVDFGIEQNGSAIGMVVYFRGISVGVNPGSTKMMKSRIHF